MFIASSSLPLVGQELAASSGKLTDDVAVDPTGLFKSCVSVPADPSARSSVTVDLETSQTVSEVVLKMPRTARSRFLNCFDEIPLKLMMLSGLDPIGVWLFDFSTDANDVTGNGNDGQVLPDTPLTTGIYGQTAGAMEIKGNVISGIIIPNPPSLNNYNYLYAPNKDFSFFIWVFPYSGMGSNEQPLVHFYPTNQGCCG